jgi:hypothetical protein
MEVEEERRGVADYGVTTEWEDRQQTFGRNFIILSTR